MTRFLERARSLFNTRIDWPRTALSLSFVQAAVVTALEAVVIIQIIRFINLSFSPQTSGYAPFITVYLGLFILALWCQGGLAVDAYFHRNSIQVIGVVAFNCMTLIYSVCQVVQVRNLRGCFWSYASIFMVTSSQQTRYHNVFNLETDTSRTCRFQSVRLTENNRFEAVNLDYTPETIAASILKNIGTFDTALSVCYSIIAFMLVFNVACGYLSYKTFGVYGWSIYQIQGADIQKREILKRYYIFMTVMKMNIFFFLGIFAQLVIAIYFKVKVNTLDPVNVDGQPEDLERTRMRLWIFTIIGFLAALLYFVLGYVGMRRGSMILMGGFLFMMAAYMVAVFYFLVQANTDHDYSVTRIWLTVFTVFQVLLNVGTLVSAGFAMRDFSNGLGDLVKSVIVVKAPADPEQKPANENARMLLD